MRVTKKELSKLITNKLNQAGLSPKQAELAAEVLVFADTRGIHSHGAIRVEYYAEQIAKGGITLNPEFKFEKTGPASGVFQADNGCGLIAARYAMQEAIAMAEEVGVAVVGVKNMSHSGALAFYVEMAAKAGMISLSVCQSDPMVVPYGGSEAYFGTNPIAFGAPTADHRRVIFDMATTVQAWGKILYARSRKESIPEGWAVDSQGYSTTDSTQVNALLPIAGAKGYGLMMMVDVLAGVLLGLPFGKHVSSMYADLSKGRDLGQLHIVINPAFFGMSEFFKANMSRMLDELKAIQPAPGFNEVYYPGEPNFRQEAIYEQQGIEIVDSVYDYLTGEALHFNYYDHKNKFAE